MTTQDIFQQANTSTQISASPKVHGEDAIKVNPQRTARFAGFLYLILAVASGWAFMHLSSLIVPGDAAGTVANIRASLPAFRIGILSDLFGQAVFIFLALTLYRLLKAVNRNQAITMVVLVIISVTLQSLSALNQIAALLLVNGGDYLSAFNAEQIDALVLFFINLHSAGFSVIAQIYFGLWLFPLGILIYKSGFLPRILGALLIIAGLGYLVDVMTYFLVPDFGVSFSEFTFIGELLIILWLLIKGVNVEQWKKRALETA
jgi:hypothetical protein